MAKIQITVNENPYEVNADPQMPLLWVIRDLIGLTGTKYGCGIAQCAACTVSFGGESCTLLLYSGVGGYQ